MCDFCEKNDKGITKVMTSGESTIKLVPSSKTNHSWYMETQTGAMFGGMMFVINNCPMCGRKLE
jgi:hypothetical protein